jgi:hypothetical protein
VLVHFEVKAKEHVGSLMLSYVAQVDGVVQVDSVAICRFQLNVDLKDTKEALILDDSK